MRGQTVSGMPAFILVVYGLVPLATLALVRCVATPVWLTVPAEPLALMLLAHRLMVPLDASDKRDVSHGFSER